MSIPSWCFFSTLLELEEGIRIRMPPHKKNGKQHGYGIPLVLQAAAFAIGSLDRLNSLDISVANGCDSLTRFFYLKKNLKA
jgi:hypothetical protein